MSTSEGTKFYSIRAVVLSIVLGCCFLNFSTSFAETNIQNSSNSTFSGSGRFVNSDSSRIRTGILSYAIFDDPCLMSFVDQWNGFKESRNERKVKDSPSDFAPIPYSAYRTNFPSIIEDPVSSSISYIEEGSTQFEEKIRPIVSRVKSIYGDRKLDVAGDEFLKKWLNDVKKHQYDSYLVKVLSGKTISGTLRIAAPDKKGEGLLPLENFLGIKLKDSNPDRYEIGLLTVNRGLSVEEKYRVHLEIWLNLVRFFKERGQKIVKVYAFSDVFGTRLYGYWGFSPVESYIKDGKVVSRLDNGIEYKSGLLVGKNQITVLEYDLSRDNLAELLELFTRGRFDINSDIVIDRLQALHLDDVFEQEQ